MISIIVAMGKNNEIGKNNKLIWNLPNDLKHFKNITNNHKVIMGYNTYLSIGHPLSNRENIVIIDHYMELKDIKVYTNIKELMNNEITDEEVFVIGGSSLYNYFINIADRLYITEINDVCNDADTYFPKFDKSKYSKKILDENSENNIEYKFVLYERIK